MSLAVATFYKFIAIADAAALRLKVIETCRANAIFGTVLIAPEGINATIAGPPSGVDALLTWLRADARFADLVIKQSTASVPPFRRLKVKLKREIVTFDRPEADPAQRTGAALDANAWNTLLRDPDVVLIDTRNTYEVAVGTFPGARDPGTRAFHEFPDYVQAHLDPARDRKVAMFCTGGIRCEKASAYLLAQGFAEVYQLDGGILKYLETVAPAANLWQGECYVFDSRMALKDGLAEGSYTMRRACGHPVAKAAAGNGIGQSTATIDEGGPAGDAPELAAPCPLCART